METITHLFQDLYKNFNNRNIDSVITQMATDVKWANGMDGGFVYGHDGVREYWTRQFKVVQSRVLPLHIHVENKTVKIKVHQIVHDMQGNLLADEIVFHLFYLENGKISEFVIDNIL